MDLPHAVEPGPVAERRFWPLALAWLPRCLLGSVFVLLLALTPAASPTVPVQPPGPDSLSLGSGLAADPVASLALDIGEHLSAFTAVGAQVLPLHPDPELHRPCMVEDGKGFALEPIATTLALVSFDRASGQTPPADAFSTLHATRLDRPPQQRT